MGWIAALLAGGVLLFNSKATPARVGNEIEKSLRSQYPQSQIEVEVRGKRGLNVTRGKFKSVRIQMTNVSSSGDGLLQIAAVEKARKAGRIGQLSFGLRDFSLNGVPIQSADVTWNDVVYDVKSLKDKSKLELQSVGQGSAKIVVAASSLQALLEAREGGSSDSGIQKPKVVLRNGRIELSGEREVPLLGVQPFSLNARLESRNGNEIWLADAKGTVAGAPLPSAFLEPLLKGFNPIYRFELNEKWPFRALLQEVRVLDDTLQIDAALTFIPASEKSPIAPVPDVTSSSPTPQVVPSPA